MTFAEAVKCPPGEDLNEWLAMNTIELYNTMVLCFGIVSEHCTPETCPEMSAGPKATYFWADKNEKVRSPTRCAVVSLTTHSPHRPRSPSRCRRASMLQS